MIRHTKILSIEWCIVIDLKLYKFDCSIGEIKYASNNANTINAWYVFDFCHRKKKKKKQHTNPSWIRWKNNYINSRIQSRPESGMNPFSINHNSFLKNYFFSKYFIFIQEGIMINREGIHTRFWPRLNPGINIIIFSSDSTWICMLLLFLLFPMAEIKDISSVECICIIWSIFNFTDWTIKFIKF